jgi:hypothetical protein
MVADLLAVLAVLPKMGQQEGAELLGRLMVRGGAVAALLPMVALGAPELNLMRRTGQVAAVAGEDMQAAKEVRVDYTAVAEADLPGRLRLGGRAHKALSKSLMAGRLRHSR